MIVRWRTQPGAFAAGLQQLFLLPSSTAVVTPWCYTSLGKPPTEAAVHLRGRLRPSLEVTALEQTILWQQIPTEQPLADILPFPGKKWCRAADKGKGGIFLFSVLLVLFKLYLSEAWRNVLWCKYAHENGEVLFCWPLRGCAGGALSYPFPRSPRTHPRVVSLLPPQPKSLIAHVWEPESRSQMSSH